MQKRAFVESMLQSSLPTATVGTLMTNRVLKEMKARFADFGVHAHRNEKAVVVGSDAAWARRDLSSTLGFFSGVTTRSLQGGRHGVTPTRRSKKIKAQSRIMSERRHVADAEQELYFTRLQLAEFLGFLVNDETV